MSSAAHAAAAAGSAAGRRPDRRGAVAESADPPRFDARRPRASRPRAAAPATRDRVVGRLAALRLRRDVARGASSAIRPTRRSSACWSPVSARRAGDLRFGYLPALRAGAIRSIRSGPGRRRRRSRTTGRRPELLPQRVRPRAQPLRRRVPPPAAATPDGDSGLRDPDRPGEVVRYRDVRPTSSSRSRASSSRRRSPRSTRSSGRRSSSTTSPCTSPCARTGSGSSTATPTRPARARARSSRRLGTATAPARTRYSVFAAGPGIFGLGNRIGAAGARDAWSLANPDDVNGGTNHFGSPFNFPEEFVTVYRLHPLLPDLLELRALARDPNDRPLKLPVVDTFRGRATDAMRSRGLASWALARAPARRAPDAPEPPAVPAGPRRAASEARRRRSTSRRSTSSAIASEACRASTSSAGSTDCGSSRASTTSSTGGCRTGAPRAPRAGALVRRLRDVYGQHRCDASKPSRTPSSTTDGTPVNDCLGHADGTQVDNVEDLDTRRRLAGRVRRGRTASRSRRPSSRSSSSKPRAGCSAIASSPRASAPSSTDLGLRWVNDNGPDGKHGAGGRTAPARRYRR